MAVIVRSWSGDRVGVGTPSDEIHHIRHPSGQNPKVKVLSPSDSVASGGSLQFARFEVGPVTPDYPAVTAPAPARPPFSGGGEAASDLDPPTMYVTPKEVLYRITGPGLPAHGMLCKKVLQQFDAQLHYTLTLEAMTESP